MAWSRIVGQHTVQRLLQRAVARGRLPHALLLTGDDGAGVLALAIELARVVNCEHKVLEGGSVSACGACRSCRQAATLQHPNISVITALPAGKADTEADLPVDVVEELAHQLRMVAEDPYQPLGLTGATQIRIGQIRELKRTLSLSAPQEGRRVVIINHVEDMTTEAANAFLKTLEEPHEGVHLILTSAAPTRLLPTITSRCQEIVVPPLDDDDLVAALVSEGTDPAEASLVAPFAEGSLVQARAYVREDVQAERAEAIGLLRAALKGRDYRVALVTAVNNAADRRDRQRAILMLSLIALWLRDVQSVLALGNDAPIANIDQREGVVRFAESFGMADLSLALESIERGVRDVRRNVTISLVLLTTLIELRKLFHHAARTASAQV